MDELIQQESQYIGSYISNHFPELDNSTGYDFILKGLHRGLNFETSCQQASLELTHYISYMAKHFNIKPKYVIDTKEFYE